MDLTATHSQSFSSNPDPLELGIYIHLLIVSKPPSALKSFLMEIVRTKLIRAAKMAQQVKVNSVSRAQVEVGKKKLHKVVLGLSHTL
jgi:BarA-like signal transduction histidine kinase